ncbi:MAG: CdaR family protein [Eubacteriales bacterium]|nr:CdaR family protein [Eubacteriales bacterium]
MKRPEWNKERLLSDLNKVWRAVRGVVSHNIGLKLLSFLGALFLWSYVITTNPSITRSKVIEDIDLNVTGQSVLTGRNLALLTDTASELEEISARVNVSQSSFGLVQDTNVRAELDLTQIRTTGTHMLNLKGTSVYGEVVQLWPEFIEVEVEELVERYVPVNVTLTGMDSASYWYSTRMNPTQVTVSGPASVVQTVSSADIVLDVSQISSSYVRAEQFTLRSSSGEAIDMPLTCSTSSIMVYLDVYPTKTVPILNDPKDVLTGSLPTGYEIVGVEISPAAAVIAAEQSLLDTIDSLSYSKVDVSYRTSSFARTVRLSGLTGLKYISTDQAVVNISIAEIDTTRKFDNIPVSFVNHSDAISATALSDTISVVVTGPYTQVEALTAEDIIATVDLTGLELGEYDIPVYVVVGSRPDIVCTAAPSEVTVRLE